MLDCIECLGVAFDAQKVFDDKAFRNETWPNDLYRLIGVPITIKRPDNQSDHQSEYHSIEAFY